MTSPKHRIFKCASCAVLREHEVREDQGLNVYLSCAKVSRMLPRTRTEREWQDFADELLGDDNPDLEELSASCRPPHPGLLGKLDLQGRVITGDDQFAQRKVCRRIVPQGRQGLATVGNMRGKGQPVYADSDIIPRGELIGASSKN